MALGDRFKRTGKGGSTSVNPKTASGKGKGAGEDKPGRLKQMALVFTMTRKSDPMIGWILLGVFLVVGAIGFALFFFLIPGGWGFDLVTGIMLGLLATLIVFGRRAQKAQYAQMEGQTGAAAAVLQQLGRGWKVEPAIAFNRNQDLVHRVVGPPGVVLVGEGNPNRLRSLLGSEHRKHARVVSETPIFEVVSGDGPDSVSVPKLNKHVTKLGRNLKPADMTDVLARLRALDAHRSNMPVPKGPMPTSAKGARQNMRGR